MTVPIHNIFVQFTDCVLYCLCPSAVFHFQDGVSLCSNCGVVGDDDDGAAVDVGKLFENGHNIFRVECVQIASGFVCQNDFAALCKSPGDSYPLSLPPREAADIFCSNIP